MSTEHLFVNAGRKTRKFLGWIIGVLVVLLLSWGVGFAGTFVPYDDFSDSSAIINRAKWGQYESVREITEGQLRLKARSSRNYTSTVSLGVSIQNPATVNAIGADMTLHAYDNTEGARPQMSLYKTLYNDGTGTNSMGEVYAIVVIGGPSQSPTAVLLIKRRTTADGSQSEYLSVQTFSTAPALDTPYSASINWNGSTVTGTFNDESLTYTPATAIQDIHYPGCTLSAVVDTNYANGAGKEATIEGFFDNVKVNGVAYDDFSGSTIDETKWYNYEFVREIDGGKLRLETRSSTAYTSSVESYLAVLRPLTINAIESKVRLTSFDNQHAASCRVQLYGRFFNDGSAGGGYTGDHQARVYLGGSGTSPAGYWQVIRYTGATIDTGTTVASGSFSKTISIGVDYTVSVEWDGSKFIFKIDDESKEYTPVVSTILPANMPAKGLDAIISSNSGKEATIAALFDDVRIVDSPFLYATFTGAGLYKWNGSTWTQLTPYEPTAMTATGSLLYATFGNGVWQYNGSAWSQLTPYSPEVMVASGSLLYGKYPNGIWQYDGSTWTQLTPYSPIDMIVAGSLLNGKYDNGIWQYNGSTWTQLTPYSPSAMVAAGSLLYGKYDNGIWMYNGSSWSQLTPYSPTTMVATGSLLYGKYDNGIWQYNGSTWTQLTPNNPEAMVASGSLLYGDFGSTGIWMYNGSTWTQITPNDPASMTGN